MKKIILPLFLLLLLNSHGFAQLKLGIQAGINGGRFGFSLEDVEEEKELRDATKYKPGYSAGIISDYNLSDEVSLQTGLTLTRKGAGYEDNSESMGTNYNTNIKVAVNFLELPVHIVFNHGNFQVHAGPYLGVGISGKSTQVTTSTKNDQTNTRERNEKIVFRNKVAESFTPGNNEIYLRRLDYGLDLGVGYKIGNALVRATHSWGLTDIVTNREGIDNKDKRTYRVLSLSLAYFFLE